MAELHTALRTDVEETLNAKGLQMQLVRLQHGKNSSVLTLHVNPSSFSTSGLQSTDMLSYLGFTSAHCPFLGTTCFASEVPDGVSLEAFADAFNRYSDLLKEAESALLPCGYILPQPEGLAHFLGRSSTRRMSWSSPTSGDGHNAAQHERMKDSEDSHFQYVFTWIKGSDTGWVTHYHPKNDVAGEMMKRFRQIISDIQEFRECPEFDFGPCWWRFEEFAPTEDVFQSNANIAHEHFDKHATSFAKGLSALIASDAVSDELKLSSRLSKSVAAPARIPRRHKQPQQTQNDRDVFMCHASEDKSSVVEPLCTAMDAAAMTYWIDKCEVQWGDSVTAKVNRGFAMSEYIIVVLSRSFLGKPWPERELNAALNLESTSGQVVVLPLLVGDDNGIKEILNTYPLLNDKKYIRWSGDATVVLDELRVLLGRN
jgi:hypothetical protein